MLTLKLITEQTERVIKGLEKKHFNGAKEAIEKVIATDKIRREAQTKLDQNLSESKKMAAQIGALMKAGGGSAERGEQGSGGRDGCRTEERDRAALRYSEYSL